MPGNAVPGSNPGRGPQDPGAGPAPAGWFKKAVDDIGKQMKAMGTKAAKFVKKMRFTKGS